jgi:hypothetical protein
LQLCMFDAAKIVNHGLHETHDEILACSSATAFGTSPSIGKGALPESTIERRATNEASASNRTTSKA